MAALTERLEVRLQPRALQNLRREAERHGISLAEAVRQAIDLWLEEDHQARQQAAEVLFRVGAPVADWEQMKAEIIEGYTASDTR
jgi:hypothetical protein